ncbi:hypothetical protein F5884DRAFT_178590 [Xylogone sp. PMI_703]|nr:hypothetical protein F5884DRAFT_178590 [Xylogone sp. PMI_703]
MESKFLNFVQPWLICFTPILLAFLWYFLRNSLRGHQLGRALGIDTPIETHVENLKDFLEDRFNSTNDRLASQTQVLQAFSQRVATALDQSAPTWVLRPISLKQDVTNRLLARRNRLATAEIAAIDRVDATLKSLVRAVEGPPRRPTIHRAGRRFPRRRR